MDKFEILVAGTGGQGVLVLGAILDQAARLAGFETVIGSEIHGMAQRGGALTSYTRFGKDVHGPIISVGSADVIIALECIEGLRNLDRLSKNGWMVVAETRIPSSGLWSAGSMYPSMDEVLPAMRTITDKVISLDAEKIAMTVGSIKTTNLVMLGATVVAVGGFPIAPNNLERAIRLTFPEKLIEINIKAFREGMYAVRN